MRENMYREARDRQARIAASISWHMIKKKEVGNTQRNKMVGCVVEMRKHIISTNETGTNRTHFCNF